MKIEPRIADTSGARLRGDVTESDHDLLTLRVLLTRLWRGRWTVVGTVALFALVAGLAVSRMQDRYRASASVMFGNPKANIVDLKDILTDPIVSKDTLQNEIEVLRSTSLLQRVASDLDLAADPEFNPDLDAAGPGLLGRLGAALPAGLRPAAPEPPADPARRTRLVVIERILQRLTLTPVTGTRVIEISLASRSPETSAAIVNAIADQYIVDQLSAKMQTTRSAIEWLTTRVDEARGQVRAAEDAVEQVRADLAEEAGQGLDITRQQLLALNAALSEAQGRTAETTARYRRLDAALKDGTDMATVPEFRQSGRIVEYRDQETALLARLDTLSPQHPEARQIRSDLAALRASIQVEARDIVAAIGIDLQAARANEASLTESVRDLETKALDQSREGLRLRQLERDADANRLIYETMLNRLKEASEQVGLQEVNARVLSPAEPPLDPESSRKKLIVAMAAALGSLAGVGLVFLSEQLSNTFRAAQQVEALTGRPVLASVPRVGSRRSRPDLVRQMREKPNAAFAESIRSLRTHLLFCHADRSPRVVMFTSSAPQEGKSTTAMLTALTSRQMGKTTILVDCDLRRPSVVPIPGADRDAPGLLAVLDRTAALHEAIQVDPGSGLHLLMSGRMADRGCPNAADALASPGFGELIRDLERHYDLIVLDAPPTLVLADARILSALCDAVVYALRWDSTPREAVLEGLRELDSVDAPIAGIVITMVNESRAAKYGFDGSAYVRRRFRTYYRE